MVVGTVWWLVSGCEIGVIWVGGATGAETLPGRPAPTLLGKLTAAGTPVAAEDAVGNVGKAVGPDKVIGRVNGTIPGLKAGREIGGIPGNPGNVVGRLADGSPIGGGRPGKPVLVAVKLGTGAGPGRCIWPGAGTPPSWPGKLDPGVACGITGMVGMPVFRDMLAIPWVAVSA